MRISAEPADLVSAKGGGWSIENPASSMIWATPEFTSLAARNAAFTSSRVTGRSTTQVRSVRETSGVGTRTATPSIRPFTSGMRPGASS